ncbi:MAG: MATE family efflux transporter [Lachnospiraceae bacterium]|nr:MATE family efflux transporter [Lachnospiraceae bacterium]
MDDKKILFEKTPVPKAMMALAIPTIISQLITLIYNLADTFYVGRTGNPYMIASVSLAYTLFIMTTSIANLFGIGGGGLVSRLMGVNENERAKNVCAYSVYGALVVGAVYSLIIAIFMTPILTLFGASENTMTYAKQYTWLVVVIGTIPIVLSQTLAHFLRNTGYSKQASMGLSGGGIINIILDPLFMFVVFPQGSEVVGAALATLLSNIASMIYFFIMVNKVSKGGTPVSVSLRDRNKAIQRDKKEIISVGIPAAILPGLYDVANIFLNARMAAHGDMQLAAIGTVLKIERLPNAIGIGISQGMLPLVAYNYAAGKKERMNRAISFARNTGIVISICTTVLYEIFAGQIAGAFIATSGGSSAAQATLGFAVTFLRIRALAATVTFLNYHTSYCLQAMGDGRDTLIHSVARQLIFYIPLMLLFDVLFGENGLTWALLVGETLGAVTALIFLRNWKKKTIQ